MIDWLRRDVAEPAVTISGRVLPLAISRRRDAKRMTLRVADDGSHLKVTLPRWGRTQDALEFARARSEWIANVLSRIPERKLPQSGGVILHRGEELKIVWTAHAPRKVIRDGTALHLGGPQDTIATRLRRWLEVEAQILMGADLVHFCERAEVHVPPLRLSRARRRWGSCSSAGTVRINWRLVQAPDHVRRSVVAHEVAHLVHFDHSREFHALVDRIFDGDARRADAWLKKHGRSLYSHFD